MRNDRDWFVHVQLKKEQGEMRCFKRPVEPYIVSLDEDEKSAYQKLRISKDRQGASSAEKPTATTTEATEA